MPDLRVFACQGQHIAPYLDDLAQLRIEVFRDYPYLYDGSYDYETDYLRRYAECPRSLFVLAVQGEQVVGAATGMPLADEVEAFRTPFEQAGYAIDSIFYYGESVLQRDQRGQGIGKAFMAERERHARGEGFDTVAFCAVQRPDDHPRRPVGYQPLDGFWHAQGYRRVPALQTRFAWKDLDDTHETYKPMMFWLKELSQ
ncbi:GNAT family N-acetyltransferase [Litchfieldella xinjiangensis]|uniref:GNAT family N-acetyltransferase n=1 Tax=Litchfieldella xinjiangensis TaxID=1166948 RepID=UPI0005BE975A|nr:GNAT family N-acetyltransferase [Halomonas xinjiangensis]